MTFPSWPTRCPRRMRIGRTPTSAWTRHVRSARSPSVKRATSASRSPRLSRRIRTRRLTRPRWCASSTTRCPPWSTPTPPWTRPRRRHVIAPDHGGGFGPKEGVYPEDVLVPLLARRLGRPVKWIQTRTEFMSSTHQAREQAHHARLAATRAGRILGLDVRIVKDVGAYHYFSVHEPTNTINHLPSQYKVPAFRAEAFSVVTNKVPSAPYRGAGRPEAILVMERF